MLCIFLSAGNAAFGAAVNCHTQGATYARFCVSVSVVNGYLAINGGGEIHPLPKTPFPTGKYTAQEQIAQLNSLLTGLFREKHLYELILAAPAKTTPPSAPPAAATVSGASLKEGLAKLKMLWPGCPQCDLTFVSASLNAVLGNLKMKSDTPLLRMWAGDANDSILAFDVDPPALDLNKAMLTIGFDLGAMKLDPDGRLQSGAAVRNWMKNNFEGRFWVASEIQSHFNGYYQAIGLNPTVIVSAAGQARSVTISESSRIGRITFPGNGTSVDPNVDKLAYLLLRSDQWGKFQSGSLPSTGGGLQFPLCLPALTGGQCTTVDAGDFPNGDAAQKSLDYLSAFWLAERTADLQALGYGVQTVDEVTPPTDSAFPDLSRIPAIDLNVQKLSTSAGASSSGQTPAASTTVSAPPPDNPSPEAESDGARTTADYTRPPAAASVHAADQKAAKREISGPGDAQITDGVASRIEPIPMGATPPQLKDWIAEYGVAVQYRPNQALRVLAVAQTPVLNLGSALLSASGQAGTDGTHPLGNGNINADWLWFDKIRRRLQFQLTGSTDALSRRILGGAYTDERRTGGNALAQLELFRDNRGFAWNVFAEPQRQTVSLTRSNAAAGGGNLSTLTVGTGIVYNRWITTDPIIPNSWITTAPTRIALNSQTRVGIGLGTGESNYNVFDVDGAMHQRLSNTYLISADVSGKFQVASALTPVFELPSLGGSNSVRGFQTDDALGRKMWSLQSEIWAPVPFTLNATESSGVLWFLRKNVRTAVFFDVGGVSDTSLAQSPGLLSQGVSSAPGIRKGSGAGIRFIQGPIALKLDWAYGFGQGAFGEGHGRFYLGVSTNGTF